MLAMFSLLEKKIMTDKYVFDSTSMFLSSISCNTNKILIALYILSVGHRFTFIVNVHKTVDYRILAARW